MKQAITIKSRLFYTVRAGTDQDEPVKYLETVTSDQKNKEALCSILRFLLIATFSCFRTFLIFIQSYIFNLCIYFKCFFLYLFLSFFSVKLFLQVYIQEAGEGISPILSFLHTFVMVWNRSCQLKVTYGI